MILIYELKFYKLKGGILGNRIQKGCYMDFWAVVKVPLGSATNTNLVSHWAQSKHWAEFRLVGVKRSVQWRSRKRCRFWEFCTDRQVSQTDSEFGRGNFFRLFSFLKSQTRNKEKREKKEKRETKIWFQETRETLFEFQKECPIETEAGISICETYRTALETPVSPPTPPPILPFSTLYVIFVPARIHLNGAFGWCHSCFSSLCVSFWIG